MKFVCIHGHFYQPPRENPWLEAVERQDSAYPFHDWNERIVSESYGPNAHARILDSKERIAAIINNYSKISFNFGPSLLSWLESREPQVYRAILDADKESARAFSGHGSALGQSYSHSILPLASRRDKLTEIRWGIADFAARFERQPEGVWLPEAAADSETLELLAAEGIKFVVLAPHQAASIRAPLTEEWTPVDGGRVDPRRAYRVPLPSGASIAAFFYDGPVSRGVAFEGLLKTGEFLAERLLGAFGNDAAGDPLVHIATDGETYGHHHRFGEMALAYALDLLEKSKEVRLTNYGEYLAAHPPQWEARVVEKSSWSCAHGVERWRSDCGCSTGGGPGWNQAWRAPLRSSLEWARDRFIETFEREGFPLFQDPWRARDAYISVILDRSEAAVSEFLERECGRRLSGEERTRALKLLELERHSLLMFTSCGWFFNDLSGIETVQILRYACRGLQLDAELTGRDLQSGFLDRLCAAVSNEPERGDGAAIFAAAVRPAAVDMLKVGAHYGVSSLFEDFPETARVYCYSVKRVDSEIMRSGKARLVFGRTEIKSEITFETAAVSFSFLHLGDHRLHGGARPFLGEEAYTREKGEVAAAFGRGEVEAVIEMLDERFPESKHSLGSLFRDDQGPIMRKILKATLEETDAVFVSLWEKRAGLMHFLAEIGVPQPRGFRAAAEFAINAKIRGALEADPPDLETYRRLSEEVKRSGLRPDFRGINYALAGLLVRLVENLDDDARLADSLSRLETAAALAREFAPGLHLWKIQNAFFTRLRGRLPGLAGRASSGDREAAEAVKGFTRVGDLLAISVPADGAGVPA